MSTLSEEYINNIISHVAVNFKLTRWRHCMRKFESIGQNYFGIILPVTITGRKDDESSCDLQVVLKLAPTDERYRVSGAVTLMFSREIFVYSVLFKKYQEIQACPSFKIPTLYFVRDEYCKEVIAMRDMGQDGYKPYSKTFLDLDHMTKALESLASLHALSFIVKDCDTKLYEEVTRVCVPLTENSNKRYMEIMIDRLTKALSKFEGTPYVPLLENLKLNCSKIFNKAITLATNTCICHGDIWKENILFKYEAKKPVSACLIDYQTARVSSPAFDVLYLIISSTDTLLRKNNFYNLLDIYYKSFCKGLGELDPNTIYPRKALDDDLKVVAPACFITANTAMWLSNGLQEEGHVRSKQVWTNSEEKATAVENYISVVKAIIDDYNSYGYLPGDVMP